MNRLHILLILWLCFCLTPLTVFSKNAEQLDFHSLFDEICVTTEANFHDPIVIEQEFIFLKEQYKKRLPQVSDKVEFSALVNEMLDAEVASIRVFEVNEVKVGYIHIYSYAGEAYHNALIESISRGKLKQADALIMDLRYGLGGATPSYLNMFNTKIPIIRATQRTGKPRIMDSQWRKPAVYLTNKETTSGERQSNPTIR